MYTMKLREKTFILVIALVYLMGHGGCATGWYEYPKPEPLLETYREQLGTIGVVGEPVVPVIQFDSPPPPPPPPTPKAGVIERTGRGAGKGFQWWVDNVIQPVGYMAPMMGTAFPLGFVVYGAVFLTSYILTIPATIFGGLGGAIYEAFPSSPVYPAYVEETEAFLRNSLANHPIQETFQSSFLKEARARTSHTFVVIPKQGPQTLEPLDEIFDAGQTYKGMVGRGVDTVLELSVQRIWLKRVGDREGEINPPMVLALVVRARLVRVTEKTVWYDPTFVHETESRPYDSSGYFYYPYRFQVEPHVGLDADIKKAYQHVAEQMVHKLFLHQPTNHPAKIGTSAFFSETKPEPTDLENCYAQDLSEFNNQLSEVAYVMKFWSASATNGSYSSRQGIGI